MNLANKLTLLRVILIPFFVVFAFISLPGEILGMTTSAFIMLLIFVIAAITDKLDGYIARKYNMITTFGKFLDPLADKLLVNTALILLVGMGKIPSWITVIIIAREFIITGVRLLASEDGIVIAANFWGKLKTVTQMIAVILLLIDKYPIFEFVNGSVHLYDYYMNIASTVMILIATIATVFSCIVYLKDSKDVLLKTR